MRAIEISTPGGPEVLRLAERPMPVPKAGEVLIKVHAAGVNRPDVLQRKGAYPPPPGASDLPGLEVAGEIVDGDLGDSDFKPGQLVCALTAGGGYAEYCVAPVAHCLPVPSGWTAVQAASLPETYFTVWSNVFERARLAPGETLLVQGGASGIGVAAIGLARAFGHRVFVTAGSDEKCARCVELGAEYAINYRTEDFAQAVKERTEGRGVDVILDMVGGDYIPRELSCLAEDGRIALIAVQGGTRAEVDLGMLLRRRLTLTGSTLRPRSHEFKAAVAEKLRTVVWPMLDAGKIAPVIHQVFPLAQAAEAHALMESGAHVGKIMLEIGNLD